MPENGLGNQASSLLAPINSEMRHSVDLAERVAVEAGRNVLAGVLDLGKIGRFLRWHEIGKGDAAVGTNAMQGHWDAFE